MFDAISMYLAEPVTAADLWKDIEIGLISQALWDRGFRFFKYAYRGQMFKLEEVK
jgi:hypothetical protein